MAWGGGGGNGWQGVLPGVVSTAWGGRGWVGAWFVRWGGAVGLPRRFAMRGFWLVLGLVGCVEVPDRVFAAGDGDGFGWGDFEVRPDGWRAVDGDGDGGESVVVDGGRLERDAWSGREDGAVAGDQVGRGELVAAVDGGRCPGGGGWLPGLDRCVGVEVLGRLPEGRVERM